MGESPAARVRAATHREERVRRPLPLAVVVLVGVCRGELTRGDLSPISPCTSRCGGERTRRSNPPLLQHTCPAVRVRVGARDRIRVRVRDSAAPAG